MISGYVSAAALVLAWWLATLRRALGKPVPADLIIYDHSADANQQLQAIGHEVAHLLLGHQARERPFPLTHLDPAAAGTVLFHGYSHDDEQEAAAFTLQLVSAASNTATPQALSQQDSD